MSDQRPDDVRRPVPRSRSGTIGRRFERTGREPITAQSALGLRLLLSTLFTPVFVAAAVLFAVWAARTVPGESPSRTVLVVLGAVCAGLALLAAVDVVVVLRRLRRERGTGR